MRFHITMRINRRSFLALGSVAPGLLQAAKPAGQYLVYFGTYTRNLSKGIYVAKLDAATGKVTEPTLAAEIENPSFVAIHPNRRYLYSVTETTAQDGGSKGTVSSFSIDPGTGNSMQAAVVTRIDYEEALRNPAAFASGFPMVMSDEVILDDYAYNVYMVVEE